MNDPARQASPLLNRLARRPVASSILRPVMAGWSPIGQDQFGPQPATSSTQVQFPTQPIMPTSTAATQSLPIPQLLSSTQGLSIPQPPSPLQPSPTDRSSVQPPPQTFNLDDSLNDSSVSAILPQDLVDDNAKLDLFDSVLDELAPQVPADTIPTSVSDSPSSSLSQSQIKPDETVIADTFAISDQVPSDDSTNDFSSGVLNTVQHDGLGGTTQNDDTVGQQDPLVSMMTQSIPSDQFLPDTLNISPAPSPSRTPESVPPVVPTAEVPGITYVEQEPKNLEIPVEVEGFLERVATHVDKLPQEIVIQGNTIALNQAQPIKQAVIMLPISEEDEKKARGKSPTWSIAWLVSWSQKIIKKFTGQVVYSHSSTQVANP